MNKLMHQLRLRKRLAGAMLLATTLAVAGLSTAAPAFAEDGKGEGRWGGHGYYYRGHGDGDHGYYRHGYGYYRHGDGDHGYYRHGGYPFYFPYYYGGYWRGEHHD